MANKNSYTVEKEIRGTKYIAQFSGISAVLEAMDNFYIDGSNNTSFVKLSKYLFNHVIVEPKGLTADDFADMEAFNEVIAFARKVMQGTLKPDGEETEEKKAK